MKKNNKSLSLPVHTVFLSVIPHFFGLVFYFVHESIGQFSFGLGNVIFFDFVELREVSFPSNTKLSIELVFGELVWLWWEGTSWL